MKRLPKGVKKLGHKVLRTGEHTGHNHRAVATTAELYADTERMFLRSEGTPVVHEEHAPIIVEAGTEQVGAVREHDYLNELVREVVD